jgi:hypothetical protein
VITVATTSVATLGNPHAFILYLILICTLATGLTMAILLLVLLRCAKELSKQSRILTKLLDRLESPPKICR